ncbi:YcxB family protein [Kordia jejudonensis]|uniref:YcxB family protein n=1 Tax=Kordia jejudonensis TaxID=1348245 RepID=UPI000629A645|nr:YcxB family protein [Kordia jejudonensis]
MIDTKMYQLTKKQYMRIVWNTLRKNVLKLIPFVLIWGLLMSWRISYLLMVYIVFALFIISFILLFWFALKNLKPFFSETQLQFDEELIHLTKNGSTASWHFLRLKKVVEEEKYWLLYITSAKYIYVPKNIFLTEQDKATFKKLVNV